MPDLRRAPRILVDLPARYRSDTVSLDGRAGDLSPDGMFFQAQHPDDTEGEVHLEIDLPDIGGPVALCGEVRWVHVGERSGMGIRFKHMAMRTRLRIANFVIQRACRAF